MGNTATSASTEVALLGRRERNKRDKRERIQQAARKLFRQHGIEGTTIRLIADAADIGLGTMFSYAANKEDLLVQIFQDDVGRAVERALGNLPNGPVLEQVVHVFDAILAHHRKDLGLARVFVKETPFLDDRGHGITGFMARLYAGLAACVDRGKERGELRAEVPSMVLARNLFAIYFQHVQFWLRDSQPTPDIDRRNLRAALELQLSGLRTQAQHGHTLASRVTPAAKRSRGRDRKEAT